ncbi:hypothetical protein D3C85_1651650 [compost metagenome]
MEQDVQNISARTVQKKAVGLQDLFDGVARRILSEDHFILHKEARGYRRKGHRINRGAGMKTKGPRRIGEGPGSRL